MYKSLSPINLNAVIVVLLIALLFTSCNSGSSHPDAYVVGDIRNKIDKLSTLQLADEVESVSYIPLKEAADDESLIDGIVGYTVTEKYIYIHPVKESRIVIFDKQGNFVKTLLKKGQGPGEFNGTFIRMQADEKDNRLYVYCSNRIFVYDLEGEFIETISSNYQSIFTCKLNKDRFAAISFPYMTFQQGGFGIGIFTEKGDTIATKKDFSSPLVSPEKTGFTIGLTPPVYSALSNSVLFKTGSNDTIFRISDDNILPTCILELRNSDKEIIRSLDATDFSTLSSGTFEADGDIYISEMFETNHQYYFRFRYNKAFYVASVNKETGNTLVEKCKHPEDIYKLGDANIMFGMVGTMSYNNFPIWGEMNGNYLVQIVTPYELDLFKNESAVVIPDVLSNIEGENPIFILYKMK